VSAEQKIKDLGIELPEPVNPVATYRRWVKTGNLLFVSGTGPADDHPKGKLGRELTIEQGKAAARSTGLQILATVKAAVGSLDNVTQVVKVLGMVNSDPEFGDQPKVINGCSDLFVEVFGERGRHARSAVGMGSLPNNIPVEIEVIVEVGGAAAPAKKKPAKKKRR
jgi:enamine deaminase RidA (YjgF/YER057c/UK114 family)